METSEMALENTQKQAKREVINVKNILSLKVYSGDLT